MSRLSLHPLLARPTHALGTCCLLAIGALGCGGGPAVSPASAPAVSLASAPAVSPASGTGASPASTANPGTAAVTVAGERPGRPGCLDCVVRVCPGPGVVDDLLLEVNLPADYADVTFTWARLNVTTPAGVTHGVNLDPSMVGEAVISLSPDDFPALPKGADWQTSVSEIAVKYTDSTGLTDGETWSAVPKPGGCAL